MDKQKTMQLLHDKKEQFDKYHKLLVEWKGEVNNLFVEWKGDVDELLAEWKGESANV